MLKPSVDNHDAPAVAPPRRGYLEVMQSVSGHTKALLAHARELHQLQTAGGGPSNGQVEPSAQLRAAIVAEVRGVCSDMAHIRTAGLPVSKSALLRLMKLLAPIVSEKAVGTSPLVAALWRTEPRWMAALRRLTVAAYKGGQVATGEAGALLKDTAGIDVVAPARRSSRSLTNETESKLPALQAPRSSTGLPNMDLLVQAAGRVAPLPIGAPWSESGTVLQGIKTKWPKEVYQPQGFENFTFSKITLSDDRVLLKAATSNRGSFGKVADAVFSGGGPLMVKIVRKNGKSGADKFGRPKTHAVEQPEAIQEYFSTVKLRSIIDKANVYEPANQSTQAIFVQALRPVLSPFEGYGIVALHSRSLMGGMDEHTLMMMSRDEGDLYGLNQTLTKTAPRHQVAPLSAALALSVAAQGFKELHHLHTQARMAHLDLSTGNIFTTAFGQMKVMDFGMASKLDGQNLTEQSGFFGSIMTPEAAGFGQPNQPLPKLSHKTDVFALSAIAFEVAAAHTGAPNPFHGSLRLSITNSLEMDDTQYMSAVMQQFSEWRADRLQPGNTWVLASSIVNTDDEDPFSAFFIPLAKELPQLAEVLLNSGMAMQPSDRLESEMMLSFLADTVEIPYRAISDLMSYCRDPIKEQAHERVVEKLHQADVWGRNYRATLEAKAHVPGAPRPLP